jgi:hypothetical protein
MSNDNYELQNTPFNVSHEDWVLYLQYIDYRYHCNVNNPDEYNIWLLRNTIY